MAGVKKQKPGKPKAKAATSPKLRAKPAAPAPAAAANGHAWLTLAGARHNNLLNLTVRFPLSRFVCVTGVSGSGKSSLVNDILREALLRELNGAESAVPGEHDRIEGLEHLDKIIDIDQTAIGRTPRSNPATYIKLFDEIRDMYTRLPDSKVRGYKPGRFSFNVKTGAAGGGRCEACEGNGANKMEMDFLADVWVQCPVCTGRRFNRETLQILYKGKTIADVLEMDVQEALTHFENVPKIRTMLQTLHDVGLDYLKLGQSSTTLSGGEAQRIKLARELVRRSTGRTLYVLDEPTTGLHFADIQRLLKVLHGFVDSGNTVVVIEHNLDVIKTADWVIDLGPEGGPGGGRIVAEGTPEHVATVDASHTGVALREVLNANTSKRQNANIGADGPARGRKPSKGLRGLRTPSASSVVPLSSAVVGEAKYISVVGARQNNLKDVTVDIPRGVMTICSGPSGSGKSSFAIDTVYTEGQRRYVESLSSYARQFMGQLAPPKVDRVTGLSPSICIEQKTTSKSPRSTVGTVTEIYDYMRILWARLGRAYCPKCKSPIGTQTSDEIVERILAFPEGSRLLLLAPIQPTGSETYQQLFDRERANGYARVRVDGVIHELGAAIDVDNRRRHDVQLVVDRVVVARRSASRLADSVEQALAVGLGVMMVVAAEGETPKRPNVQTSKRPNKAEKSKVESRNVETGSDEEAQDGPSSANSAASLSSATPIRFSQHHACDRCGESYDELTPHHFSFNARMGWCEACEGLGVQQGANPGAIIAHPTKSILGGAIDAWGVVRPGSLLHRLATAVADHIGFEPDAPWSALSESQRMTFLHGCGEDWITLETPKRQNVKTPTQSRKVESRKVEIETPLVTGNATNTADGLRALRAASVSSVVPLLPPGGGDLRVRWRGFYPAIGHATRVSWQYRMRLDSLTTEVPCDACRGSRLAPLPASARLGDATIPDACAWPLGRTLEWFTRLKLDARQRKIAGELIHEIISRLRFLVDVGLDYITLHRGSATLSGGESQRIQLASQIGTGLTGVLYVLDEPTIGLHPRDNGRLIAALHKLRDLGNTLLVVEHDREVIDAADHVLDFGPGAGRFGGEITGSAAPDKLRRVKASLTGQYLAGKTYIAVPSNRRGAGGETPTRQNVKTPKQKRGLRGLRDSSVSSVVPLPSAAGEIVVRGACENNLKEIDVAFPLRRFTCVTGVSGSGKSSLVTSILYPALAAKIHRASTTPGVHDRIDGIAQIDKVINVDQSPIGNSPNSNAATYTGLFDELRSLFAKLPDAKVRGFTPGRFSFNRPGGRCEACEGMGQRCIEMHFLPDVWVVCEECKGARYVPDTLAIRYRGKSIADVLSMSIAEAVELFAAVPRVRRLLTTLHDVGLGYLQLGQSAATLSGGEAQRVKLAAELGRPSTGKTFYLLDEPTTGLHFDDLRKLLDVLHRLVDLGNTVVCIEHNLDVIKTADWVIDLGPEAGERGGTVVVEGTPEQVAACPASHTGRALRPVLAAGPVQVRPVFDPKKKAAEELAARKTPVDLGGDARMPYEIDGRAWHTDKSRDRRGHPVAWDPDMLVWLVETMESLPGMAPADWNQRALVEVAAPKSAMWFCHARTGGRDLLDVLLRVPAGTFTESALRRRLNIKTLNERGDLPVYGDDPRVLVRSHGDEWQELRLTLRDFVDVDRKVFKSFLQEAGKAYLNTATSSNAGEAGEPWITDGRKYHLSQQGIHPKHPKRWKPTLLMELIGRFNKLQPGLAIDYGTRTAVILKVPGEPKYASKLVTNIGRGIRVELRTPPGACALPQVDRLGEDVEIKRYPPYDMIAFWVREAEQIDPGQLAEAWRVGRGAGKE
jgi:excinuclease ABC subunit A